MACDSRSKSPSSSPPRHRRVCHHFWMQPYATTRVTGNHTCTAYRRSTATLRRKIAAISSTSNSDSSPTCFRSSHGALDKVHHWRRRPPVALLAQPLFGGLLRNRGAFRSSASAPIRSPSRAGPSFGSTAQPPRLRAPCRPPGARWRSPRWKGIEAFRKAGISRGAAAKEHLSQYSGLRGADSSSAASPRIPRDVLWILPAQELTRMTDSALASRARLRRPIPPIGQQSAATPARIQNENGFLILSALVLSTTLIVLS